MHAQACSREEMRRGVRPEKGRSTVRLFQNPVGANLRFDETGSG
jgi:hypothetical protein